MQSQRVRLRHTYIPPEADEPVMVQLGEIRGKDEMALAGVDTRSAIGLLARLLQPTDSQCTAEALAYTMSAADRDALLAILHRRCWGDRIVSTLLCRACGAPFDLSFTLSELQLRLHEQGSAWLQKKSLPATWQAPVPPSGTQEIAAADIACAGRTLEALQALLQEGSHAAEDMQREAEALEHTAPILDVDMDAQCAECGHMQQAHFDVQSFVLQRLLNERESLLHEIHTLATGYSWTLDDILELPRSTRRSFARLLSHENGRHNWPQAAEQQAGRFWG